MTAGAVAPPVPDPDAPTTVKAELDAGEPGVPSAGGAGVNPNEPGLSAEPGLTDAVPMAVKEEIMPEDPRVATFDPENAEGPPPPPDVKAEYTIGWWQAAQVIAKDGAEPIFRGNPSTTWGNGWDDLAANAAMPVDLQFHGQYCSFTA